MTVTLARQARGLAMLLGWLLCAWGCAQEELAPEQPLPFNHALHLSDALAAKLEDNRLTCTDCHPGAEARAQAGLPPIKYCLRCHMKPQGDPPSEAEQQVRLRANAKGPFRWIQVNHNPGHVYFSHRAHVGGAGMECQECHGEVREWTRPPRRPEPSLHDMDACMSCHREQSVSNECGTCHR